MSEIQLPPGSMDKLLTANFIAITNRIRGGQPATAAQINFLREFGNKSKTTNRPDSADYCASSHSELADALGIPRQTITWHARRDDAPKNLNAQEWRRHLLDNGNIRTVRQLEQAGPPVSRPVVTDPGIAMIGLFNFFSDSLESTVTAAGEHAGVKLSKAQAEWMTIGIWRVLAELTDAYLRAHGHERYFLERDEPDADGVPFETELPPAIVALCKRIESRPAKAKRPQCVEQPPV